MTAATVRPDVRIAWIWVRLSLPEPNLALIQVAETPEKRSVLALEGV